MYYSAKSVENELNNHKHKFSVEVSGGATFGCPRKTGSLVSKCCGKPKDCGEGKNQTCYQILYVNSKDINGHAFLLTHLVFKFAIPSTLTSSKYDGYIRVNMLKGVLDTINIENLVPVKIQ